MPDSKKVIIFTALNHGGILQLANQMAITLKSIGREFSLYVPVGSKNKVSASRNSVLVKPGLQVRE